MGLKKQRHNSGNAVRGGVYVGVPVTPSEKLNGFFDSISYAYGNPVSAHLLHFSLLRPREYRYVIAGPDHVIKLENMRQKLADRLGELDMSGLRFGAEKFRLVALGRHFIGMHMQVPEVVNDARKICASVVQEELAYGIKPFIESVHVSCIRRFEELADLEVSAGCTVPGGELFADGIPRVEIASAYPEDAKLLELHKYVAGLSLDASAA